MYIYKNIIQNGRQVSLHQISRMEIQGEVATVLLYSIEPSTEASDPVFHSHSIPMDAIAAAPYPDCVTGWLTSSDGPLEGGTVVHGNELTLEAKQDLLQKQTSKHRDISIYGGVQFQSLGIDTDETSLRNIMGTAQMAALSKMQGAPFQIAWRCSDNSMANFDADTVLGLAATVMGHVQACYQRSWELKEEIANATDDNIDAIDPSTGWPA